MEATCRQRSRIATLQTPSSIVVRFPERRLGGLLAGCMLLLSGCFGGAQQQPGWLAMFPWHRDEKPAPSKPIRDEPESRLDRTRIAAASPANDYGFDEDTWQFVQKELSDATHEEGTELLGTLDTLKSSADRESMVRMLLRTRRLMVNREKQKRARSTQLAGHSDHDAWDERQRFEATDQPSSWPTPDSRPRHDPREVTAATPAPATLGRQTPFTTQPVGGPTVAASPTATPQTATGIPAANPQLPQGFSELSQIAQQQLRRLDPLRNPLASLPLPHPNNSPHPGLPNLGTARSNYFDPNTVGTAASPHQPSAITTTAANQPQLNPATNAGYLVANTPIRTPVPGTSLPLPEPLAGPGTPNPSGEAWQQDLGRLIASLEAATAQPVPNPNALTEQQRELLIRKHLYLRMLYVMSGQGTRALATSQVPFKDDKEREFWRQVFWSLNQYFDSDTLPNRADRITQTLNQMRFAVQELQPRAHLELRNVNFCNSIASFGNYESFPRNEFPVGEEVLIYAEVVNFTSEINGERFHSRLQPTIEIYQAGNDTSPVKTMKYEATPDYCSNPRQDFYLSIVYTIPKGLAQGPHVLKLMVTDVLGNKVATYPLRFTVR
ncbi:MAG: hypothetical protein O3A00_24980 [Planctomycetota bacterium]|nr:hypothetical protein [Planctomycetota bacterium]